MMPEEYTNNPEKIIRFYIRIMTYAHYEVVKKSVHGLVTT